MNPISVKYSFLKILSQNDKKYVSGEVFGRELGISRTAVWKHVQELRGDGYKIEACTRQGYRLVGKCDIINPNELRTNLNTSILGKNIQFMKETESTNDLAESLARGGGAEGTVIIADRQIAGRGRMGRIWISPPGKGIWMSLILRPSLAPAQAQLITLAASLAVSRALYKVAHVCPGIKWPNDVILDGKKVCGILTEMNTEINRINYIILGIGINFGQRESDFEDEIREKAISLSMYLQRNSKHFENIFRSDIIKAVIEELEELYTGLLDGDRASITEGWKKYSITLGRIISVVSGNIRYIGKAVDIAADGSLVIEREDGTTKTVASGEASIRGIMGYI